jgi:hypothetical protein
LYLPSVPLLVTFSSEVDARRVRAGDYDLEVPEQRRLSWCAQLEVSDVQLIHCAHGAARAQDIED